MTLFANRNAAQVQPQTFQPTARPQMQLAAAAPTPAPPPAPRPSYGDQQPQREVSESLYDGIEKNKDTSRTYFDEPCDLLLEVIKLSDGYKPKGTRNAGKPFFGADFKVVGSNNPNYPIGSEGSWMSTENDYPEYHLKSINNLLSAILQVDSSQVTKATVIHARSEENPAQGAIIRMEIRPDPRAKPNPEGKPFTKKKFFAFIDQPTSAA